MPCDNTGGSVSDMEKKQREDSLKHLKRFVVLALLLAQHAEIVRHLSNQRMIAATRLQTTTEEDIDDRNATYPPYMDSSF